MHDRPNLDELLRGVELLLDEYVKTLSGAGQYNARVAGNVVRTVRRELQHEDRQLEQEWAGLDALLGPAEKPVGRAALREAIRQRTADLSERIRAGDADGGEWRRLVIAHVRDTVRGKLEVANPRWLEADTRERSRH